MKKGTAIFLCILISVILFMSGYQVGRNSVRVNADTIRLSDTVRLTVPAIVKEIRVPVPADVDTAAILQKYFTKRVYNDTIIQTKFIQVNLTDTVYMNGLLGRTASYTFNFPEYNHSFSAGVMGGYRILRVMAAYRHKRLEFMCDYNLIDRSCNVGAKYYLFRWK